jgi:hypothetical protein
MIVGKDIVKALEEAARRTGRALAKEQGGSGAEQNGRDGGNVPGGFPFDDFTVDTTTEVATCPAGHTVPGSSTTATGASATAAPSRTPPGPTPELPPPISRLISVGLAYIWPIAPVGA